MARFPTTLLARQLFSAGRWADAARAARHAARKDPSFGAEAAEIWGISALREGRATEALSALTYALAQNPASTRLRIAYAEAALANGDDVTCEQALDASAAECAEVDELRAALRRARCELPTNNAFASLSTPQRVTSEQWESAVRLLLTFGQVGDAQRLLQRQPASALRETVRWLEALVATALGEPGPAIAAWRKALEVRPELSKEAFEAMLEVDAPAEAEAIAQAVHRQTGSPLLRARLALYGGRLDEAEALLTAAPPSEERAALQAALLLLRGDAAAATALLHGLARGPGEELLYVEALRRCGQLTEAQGRFRALAPPIVLQVAAAPLCQTALAAASGRIDPEHGDLLQRLRTAFPSLSGVHDPLDFATTALDSLSGNWSQHATRLDPTGVPRHQPIPQPIRRRVAALQGGLWGLPLPRIIAMFEELRAQHPTDPLILTYGAELLLWWGDYTRSAEWLEDALALDERTRWAYIGAAILANVTSRPEAALASIDRQRALLAPLANSFVCTAEAHLLLGDTGRARADYEAAVDAHPTRVSAWLGLALTQHLSGEDPQRVLEHVARLTPVFFRQWQREASGLAQGERLRHALAMLRGNRSSSLITWRTADGTFHGEHAPR